MIVSANHCGCTHTHTHCVTLQEYILVNNVSKANVICGKNKYDRLESYI